MAPRSQTLPSAKNQAAREAMQSFYCNLCSKGYSRMNEYEAHLSSYDHSHKQRLKDMKAMVRDPNAGARARKAEAKADGLVSIKLPGSEAPQAGFKKGGFKKSGFKSAFAPAADAAASTTAAPGAMASGPALADAVPGPAPDPVVAVDGADVLLESDTDDEGYEMYDPRRPTE